MARTSRARYLRRREFPRLRRGVRFLAWLAQESARLLATATGDVFVRAVNNVTAVAHGVSEGEGPYQMTTTITLPAGLELLTDYFAEIIDVDNILWHIGSRNGASVVLTDAGAGVHTFTKAGTEGAIFTIQRRNRPLTILATADIDDLA